MITGKGKMARDVRRPTSGPATDRSQGGAAGSGPKTAGNCLLRRPANGTMRPAGRARREGVLSVSARTRGFDAPCGRQTGAVSHDRKVYDVHLGPADEAKGDDSLGSDPGAFRPGRARPGAGRGGA